MEILSKVLLNLDTALKVFTLHVSKIQWPELSYSWTSKLLQNYVFSLLLVIIHRLVHSLLYQILIDIDNNVPVGVVQVLLSKRALSSARSASSSVNSPRTPCCCCSKSSRLKPCNLPADLDSFADPVSSVSFLLQLEVEQLTKHPTWPDLLHARPCAASQQPEVLDPARLSMSRKAVSFGSSSDICTEFDLSTSFVQADE